MNRSDKLTRAGRRLILLGSLIALIGASTGSAGPGLYINETFDPPTLNCGGWADQVDNPSFQYVTDGVKGSTAFQISGTLLNANSTMGGGVAIFAVVGNEFATVHNTVLSFDVKVDQPGFQGIVVGLQSWGGFNYSYFNTGLPITGSIGGVPMGPYTPGKFKTLSVALDDPTWVLDFTWPYPDQPLDGMFLPNGKTYQIFFDIWPVCLPQLGEITLTIDNIKFTSANLMVPWNASSAGQLSFEGSALKLTETGIADHLDSYTATLILPTGAGVPGSVEITAENGDKLFGSLVPLSDTAGAVSIEDGTGRFENAKGSYIETFTWVDGTTYKGTSTGAITSVGANKK